MSLPTQTIAAIQAAGAAVYAADAALKEAEMVRFPAIAMVCVAAAGCHSADAPRPTPRSSPTSTKARSGLATSTRTTSPASA